MATFALMLKACQKDASFADAHILPHVLDMSFSSRIREFSNSTIEKFFNSQIRDNIKKEILDAFELMQDAESLGSIMKFDIAESTLLSIQQTLNYWQHEQFVPEEVEDILPAMELILTLTDKYAALVMNPPYMGYGNMNEVLANYVKRYYDVGKADLCTSFMIMQANRTIVGGYYANIIPPSWMFLSTFEGLRHSIIENQTIQSLLHLSRGVFGADFGSVATVIQNYRSLNPCGTYFRLIERTFQEFDQKHLRILFEKTLANHDFKYFFGEYTKDVLDINYNENGAKIFYPNIEQNKLKKIPGNTIGYWLSDSMINAFGQPSLSEFAKSGKGLDSGDNNRFLRFWHEISSQMLGLGFKSAADAKTSLRKWFPFNKGGAFRKWYGNFEYVINWENDGEELRAFELSNLRNRDYYFREGITFPRIGSFKFSARYSPSGSIFDGNGPMCFPYKSLKSVLAYMNSSTMMNFVNLLCPTISFQIGDIFKSPYIEPLEEQEEKIQTLTDECITISKLDWDSHETSWDFEANPLVALRNEKVAQGNLESSFRLSDFVEEFETQWTEHFMQLHQNEEDLNRQFISIYGLEDELTPDVPLDEITILQQGEISIVNNGLEWHEDVLMKQLISYAVGVWMGRYKLGQKGLHIAHPNPTDKELQPYWYGGVQVYIDEDGLIPVLPQSSPFDDNLSSRISDFIRITFGEDKLTENLNYLEQKLGQSIDQYVQKDFWKDHKKMYQNRPIYWLFSSKKGAFKCLAYMHRMNAYTAERVRSNYLLPYIEFLQNQIGDMENRRATLSTTENRKLQTFQKALDECREYHERLQVVAEQAISFDLDDGVVVNYVKFGDVLAKIK